MKLLTGIGILAIYLLGVQAATFAKDEVLNMASGTMISNGQTSQIKYSYADEGPDDIILVLTDNPLPKESIPFGLHQLSMEGKVHGIVVTISKETKEQAPGLNAQYHEVWGGQLGTLGNAVLKIDKLDSQVIEGHIFTPEQNTFSDYTFSFDVKFKTSLGLPEEEVPIEVTIKGDDSPPAIAYANYYKALMAGDVAELKKLIIKKNAEQLDSEEAKMFFDLVKATHPRDIDIVTTDVSDKSAKLTVKGSVDNSQGTGTVHMVVEDGAWKVETDKWKFTN